MRPLPHHQRRESQSAIVAIGMEGTCPVRHTLATVRDEADRTGHTPYFRLIGEPPDARTIRSRLHLVLVSPDEDSALAIACAVPRQVLADWQASRVLGVNKGMRGGRIRTELRSRAQGRSDSESRLKPKRAHQPSCPVSPGSDNRSCRMIFRRAVNSPALRAALSKA